MDSMNTKLCLPQKRNISPPVSSDIWRSDKMLRWWQSQQQGTVGSYQRWITLLRLKVRENRCCWTPRSHLAFERSPGSVSIRAHTNLDPQLSPHLSNTQTRHLRGQNGPASLQDFKLKVMEWGRSCRQSGINRSQHHNKPISHSHPHRDKNNHFR